MTVRASIMLKSDEMPAVGRDRIRLLEAVGRHGSITGGAKEVGLSYKAAWDALDAMANLFGKPLLASRTGGRAGGGTTLTPAGIRVVEAYHRLEAGLEQLFSSIEPSLAEAGIQPFHLVSGLLMKTSARNALRGTITNISSGTITSDVTVAVSDVATIHALVTNESVRELGLVPGREAIVLIKAPFVIVAPGETPPVVSAHNCVKGTVLRCETSTLNAEVVLDIGSDKTLVAVITAQSAEALKLEPGMTAHALFDAAHVLIATD